MLTQSNIKPKKEGRQLNSDEIQRLREGVDLSTMLETPGWGIVKKKLEELAYHSWADPREVDSMKEWSWRELNAFYAANNAKELLRFVEEKIEQGDYLTKIKSGEIKTRKMKI